MYKIKHALKKGKPVFIVVVVLWIALSIVFIAPGTVSIIDSKVTEESILDLFFSNISDITGNLGKVFSSKYISTFGKGELYLAVALFVLAGIGLMKSLPKNEYTDIEHGSSDWATGGEQYQILSPKKGILLAEKNYLPVDKRGNVNVLIVGRFWFW
ncbi:MAG: hypothetical protein J6A29_02430 [Clostridia bacterium]|nr:hypothetical protein [Clostridia bacterium]